MGRGEKGKTPTNFGSRVKPGARGSCCMLKVSSLAWRFLFLVLVGALCQGHCSWAASFSGHDLKLWGQTD